VIKHTLPFDPTYGYERERLLTIPAPPAPADFESFWRSTFEENRSIPLNLSRRQVDCASAFYDLFEIEFDAWDSVRIGGWMILPKNGIVRCGFVVSHGYGGRNAPDLALPVKEAAAIFPCARGFDRSRHAKIPGVSGEHVVYGIESRESYVHRGCAAELWSAASALTTLVPETAKQLFYSGGSFGGGIGALAIPWDARFKAAYLCVPSFGNHPLRLTMQCTGSGESVRAYHRSHPDVKEMLRYYDSAIAATYIRIPTLAACALFDPAVPPPGQFCVYNAIPSRKELFVLSAGHFDYPEAAAEGADCWKRQCEWFEQALA
jgi:cephalosporin-C deacetylase